VSCQLTWYCGLRNWGPGGAKPLNRHFYEQNRAIGPNFEAASASPAFYSAKF